VSRLSSHDAHQLYQRLESPCREFVIEMKVKLLKVLTLDYKTAAGAYQFVSMLLEEYAKLCRACQTVAGFLQPLVCISGFLIKGLNESVNRFISPEICFNAAL